MTPTCIITVDGLPVSGLFENRIVSCVVTDKEGVSSDSVNIVLDDYPPAAIPRKGAIIRVWMGYAGAGTAYMGSYAAEEIEVEMLPFKMRIGGKAAGMRGSIKQNRERNWDDAKLEEIIQEVASDNDLEPVIDPEICAHVYEWQGQLQESDIHFLERLAERHDAIFSVKDGKLIFAKRGSGTSPTGKPLTPIVVTPGIVEANSARVRFSDRERYKDVTASYQDRKKGRRAHVTEDSDPAGEATFEIGEPMADEAEAKIAARSKARQLKRRQASFSCTVEGNPTARAGAPLTFALGRPGVDGLPFIVGTASHRYSKAGYTTSLYGDSQDGQTAPDAAAG